MVAREPQITVRQFMVVTAAESECAPTRNNERSQLILLSCQTWQGTTTQVTIYEPLGIKITECGVEDI